MKRCPPHPNPRRPHLAKALQTDPLWLTSDPCPAQCRLGLKELGTFSLSVISHLTGRLSPRPVGKVALFLQPGQTGTQPSGVGHGTSPCVHGPREAGTDEAVPATGLLILQPEGLQLEALSRVTEGQAPAATGRSLQSDPAHPPLQTTPLEIVLKDYNSQERRADQQRQQRVRKRPRRRAHRGRILRADWSASRAAAVFAENARWDLRLQCCFLQLLAVAEAAWISASWRGTIRVVVV